LEWRREIEEFEKTVQKLKQEMDEMEASSKKLRAERAGYYEKTDEISGKLQKAYVIQNTAKLNADQALAKIQSAREMSKQVQKEAEELDRQITDIMDNQESISVELDTSKNLEKEEKKAAPGGVRPASFGRLRSVSMQMPSSAATSRLGRPCSGTIRTAPALKASS